MSLLASASPYVSSGDDDARGGWFKGAAMNGNAKRRRQQNGGRGGGGGSGSSCMYTVQGDLKCGLSSYTDGFGDGKTVRRLRSSLGVYDEDAFDANTSRRFLSYDGLDLIKDIDGNQVEPIPCCRCKCMHVGPCPNPTDIIKTPNATCALCQTGKCNRHC